MYRSQYAYEYNTYDHFEPVNTFIIGACYICYPTGMKTEDVEDSEDKTKRLYHKLYLLRYDLLMGKNINPFYYESYNAVKIEYEF